MPVAREQEYHNVKKQMAILDLKYHIEAKDKFENSVEWWHLYCDKHYKVEYYKDEENK